MKKRIAIASLGIALGGLLLCLAAHLYQRATAFEGEAGDLRETVSRLKSEYSDYQREVDAIASAAALVAQSIERSPSKSSVVVTIKKGRSEITAPPRDDDPADNLSPSGDCVRCLRAASVAYTFESEYLRLDDTLEWSDLSGSYESTGAHVQVKDRLPAEITTVAVRKVARADNRVFAVRWTINADAGAKCNSASGLSAAPVGIGMGAEILNLQKLLHAPVGMSAYVAATPSSIEDTHIAAGVEYRVFDNIGAGAYYGRSIAGDQALIAVSIFPMRRK